MHSPGYLFCERLQSLEKFREGYGYTGGVIEFDRLCRDESGHGKCHGYAMISKGLDPSALNLLVGWNKETVWVLFNLHTQISQIYNHRFYSVGLLLAQFFASPDPESPFQARGQDS